VAIQYTIVANVLVILASNPLFSALFSWLMIGEVILLRTAVCMGVCVGAIALIFYDQIGGDSSAQGVLGNIFAVGAAVLLGLYFALIHMADRKKEGGCDMIPCNVVAGAFVAIGGYITSC
jgi:drug/metabolite transporter (DMT)-like permease